MILTARYDYRPRFYNFLVRSSGYRDYSDPARLVCVPMSAPLVSFFKVSSILPQLRSLQARLSHRGGRALFCLELPAAAVSPRRYRGQKLAPPTSATGQARWGSLMLVCRVPPWTLGGSIKRCVTFTTSPTLLILWLPNI